MTLRVGDGDRATGATGATGETGPTGPTGENGVVLAFAGALLLEPLRPRTRREALWCLIGLASGVLVLGALFAALIGGPLLLVLVAVLVATGAARRIGTWERALAARLLGVDVPPPPPRTRRLRDAPAWRATLFLLSRGPYGLLCGYALLYWVGVANVTYPFWWGGFRNHGAGVHLSPVPALTPFGVLHVASLPGTLVVFAAGVGSLLAAPWVTRAVTGIDRWLVRALLGPGSPDRIRELETSRAVVVDDAASTLRRIERDLHDGAQAQLATLAMKLGQAKEKLEHDSPVAYDPESARVLVDAAHRHAKDALTELRNIARGIHPPALDVGLEPALATLVARSPVPTTLEVGGEASTAPRATPAIATIAYFSAAELLANVAKHSGARTATVALSLRNDRVRLTVHDDGVGGARIGAGTGLTGLADRVRAVDGRFDVSSPEGGPTTIVVELPARA